MVAFFNLGISELAFLGFVGGILIIGMISLGIVLYLVNRSNQDQAEND